MKMDNEYKHICNVRDLLDGDINRMFISNNKDEVTKMMYCALNLLNEIWLYNLKRFESEE